MAVLAIAAAALSSPAGGSPQDDVALREIGALPPLPPLRRYPVTSAFRFVLRDVQMTTAEGLRIDAPLIVVEARLAEPGGPRVHVLSALVDAPVVTAPAARHDADNGDSADADPDGAWASLPLFREIGPRITADTVRIRNATVRQPATATDGAEPWDHRWRDIDLVATGVDLGGERDRLDLRLSADGVVRGRPLAIGRLALTAERTTGRLQVRADARLDATRLRATAVLARDHRLAMTVDVDTLVLDEVRALAPGLPEGGGATGKARVLRQGDGTRVVLEDLHAELGGSRATAEGTVVLADPPRPVDLLVRSDGIDATDLRRAGIPLPPGRYAGAVRARGEGAREIRVEAELERVPAPAGPGGGEGGRAESASSSRAAAGSPLEPAPADPAVAASLADRPWRVVADGVVRTGPDPRVELDVEGRTAMADSAVVVRARVRGPIDSLGVQADVPLALLVRPAGISDARGTARADLRLRRLDPPAVSGTIDLVDGGVTVDAAGLEMTGGGRVRLEDGAAVIEDVAVAVGGGRLRASGRAVPGEVAGLRIAGAEPGARPGPVDLTVEADSVRVIDDPLGQIRASGRIRVTGTLDAPQVEATVTPSGWIREDYFAPPPGLDLDDPPMASLAARVPWPADSRLKRAAAREAADAATGRTGPGSDRGRPSPLETLDGRIVVEITRGLRLIDEDSEIRATGDLVVELGDTLMTRGRVAVEDGFFAQYGTVFGAYGGAFVFDGPGLRPRIALRSTLDDDAPLVGSDEAPPAPEREPPIQQFGYGEVGSALELVTRYSLVPGSQLELVRYVLLGIQPQPVTGWRLPMVWRADPGTGLLGERATAQAVPLAWSFIADQGYDYLPLDVGYLRAGLITVGAPYPARLQLVPVMKAAAVLGDRFELRLGQPLAGEAPRLAGVYRHAGLRLEVFTGPRFYPAAAIGGGPGFTTHRRTGIGLRWGVEY